MKMNLIEKDTITSLELLNKINEFRKQLENKVELQHKTLLEIIRDEFSEEIDEQKILPISYKDSMNRNKPMYILTYSQAKQILVRESKLVRKKVIEYIEKLENALKNKFQVPTNFKEALLLALKQQEEIEALGIENKVKDQQISELKPKATYYDLVLQCTDLLSTSSIAKDFGKSAQWLNDKLHELKIQYKQSGQWLLYQYYADKGYTSSKTTTYVDNNGVARTSLHTYWTQKGRLFIYDLLKDNGILPTIERI